MRKTGDEFEITGLVDVGEFNNTIHNILQGTW